MTQHQTETEGPTVGPRVNIQRPDFLALARAGMLDELVNFFSRGEADQGLRSSWGPLADIALGGFGGTPDPERGVTDRRYRFAGGQTGVTEARRVRAALSSLSEQQQCVLFAAHGSIPWAKIVDSAFGRGMALKLQKRLGDLVGVALLSMIVQEGYEQEVADQALPIEPGTLVAKCADGDDGRVDAYWTGRAEKPTRRAAWATPGGWLVALCLDKSEASKKKAARIKTEASKLLAGAEAAYLAARGFVARAPKADTGDRRRRAASEVMA